jgi:hypothetical protein
MNYLFAFCASYIYIWAKATQQLQVVNFRYLRIMPVSLVMAFCEVFIMVNVIRTSDSFGGLVALAIAIGIGAGLGCLTAMFLYKK